MVSTTRSLVQVPRAPLRISTCLIMFVRLGHGWTGNGNHYTNNWSPLFEVDYGTPLTDSCAEDSSRPGVFRRNFTKAEIEMDCNAWQGKITMANGTVFS